MSLQQLDQKKKKKKSVDPSKQRSASANAYCHQNGEVEVTTTIKTRGRSAGVVHVRPSSAREVSLNVLKDMKKLQTTLRKDDLTWEQPDLILLNDFHRDFSIFDCDIAWLVLIYYYGIDSRPSLAQNVPECLSHGFNHGSPFLTDSLLFFGRECCMYFTRGLFLYCLITIIQYVPHKLCTTFIDSKQHM